MGVTAGNGYESAAIAAQAAAQKMTIIEDDHVSLTATLMDPDVDTDDVFEHGRLFFMTEFDNHPNKSAKLFMKYLKLLESCMMWHEKYINKVFGDQQLRIKIFTLAQRYGCDASWADWPVENTTIPATEPHHHIFTTRH